MTLKKWEKQVLFWCFVSRFVVAMVFKNLGTRLDQSVEFSTPISSYLSLQEGVFLLRNGFPLYDGGVVHHSPILVALFNFFSGYPNLVTLIYSLVDCLIVYQLMQIKKFLDLSISFSEYKIESWVPGFLYLMNPLVLLSNVSRSPSIFSNLCVSSSILFGLEDDFLLAGVSIALAGYLSLYPILLCIPITLLLNRKNRKNYVISVITTVAILLLVSFHISGNNWDFIKMTYLAQIKFQKLFPNLGLWWYFFVEMFEPFIPFFCSVFNLFALSFVGPFTVRFYKNPIFAIVLSLGWITLTRPYPTLGDCGFFLSFIPFCHQVFGYMKYGVFTTLMFLHAMILSSIFYHIWVNSGSGNSNFFYAISLVYALAIASLLVDLCWGILRLEYDNGIPNHNKKITQL